MTAIATFTANPAIDVSMSVNTIMPIHKLRCTAARREPGGGGINVARVATRLGGDVTALYPVGGPIGQLLCRLMDREGIASVTIDIAGDTREDFNIFDKENGQQYRFVLPGPQMTEAEWRHCLNAFNLLERRPEYLVASGSLPPGISENAYAHLARLAKNQGARLILDTSGPPLAAALREGVWLIKPSLRELQELVGRSLLHEADWLGVARQLVDDGRTAVVAMTLGHRGALVTTTAGSFRAPALEIQPVGTVGAGDSFLGAMVWALAQGMSLIEAMRYGVAGGSAALLTPGTELCHVEDIHRLYANVNIFAL
jgi:6-phosphofructokinase 2